jgi:hypothetical protein
VQIFATRFINYRLAAFLANRVKATLQTQCETDVKIPNPKIHRSLSHRQNCTPANIAADNGHPLILLEETAPIALLRTGFLIDQFSKFSVCDIMDFASSQVTHSSHLFLLFEEFA